MYYGELAEQNVSYQTGHDSGSIRALSYVKSKFYTMAQESPRRRYTAQEILAMLDTMQDEWMHYCRTYGYGKESEGEDEGEE